MGRLALDGRLAMDRTWTLGGRALVLLAAVAVAASLVMFAGGASASCNCVIANGKIAFDSSSSGVDFQNDVFVMNPDGSGRTQLTDDPTPDFSPAWSPGGKKIAFASYRDGTQGAQIYVMNADGSGQTRLTYFGTGGSYDPTWSPGGTKIAFTRDHFPADFHSGISVVNADGSNPIELTNTLSSHDGAPAWSPNGQKIAFARRGSRDADIYLMSADGSAQTRLTDGFHDVFGSTWSPDGTQIAFEAGVDDALADIYVIGADGVGLAQLTDTGHAYDPAWSPDGKKIAFDGLGDGAHDGIYVMSADGTQLTELTNGDEADASWQKVFVAKPSSHLIPHTGVPDSIFKWKAGGFAAREPVTMFFDRARIGAKDANPVGRLDVELTVPHSARPGKHTLKAVGRWSGVTLRDAFVVLSSTTRR
jgi:Tol biopolymer transport system component